MLILQKKHRNFLTPAKKNQTPDVIARRDLANIAIIVFVCEKGGGEEHQRDRKGEKTTPGYKPGWKNF